MKILVVGGGGREHALAHKLVQSPGAQAVFVAPGNAGTAEIAQNVTLAADDFAGLEAFVRDHDIGLTVIGPEDPLAAGLADQLRSAGRLVFGPSAAGAELEASKRFAKKLMRAHGIPTSSFREFVSLRQALRYVESAPTPYVVKANGLAQGKGVFICRDPEQGRRAVEALMDDSRFGCAGDRILIEDCLTGEEVSVLAITDGETILPLPSAQDHKRVYDDDRGANTGGMGAYSPAPALTPRLEALVERHVLVPIMHALRTEEISYRGVVYAGLMLTKGGPRVLEFNVRFGDPEIQALIVRLKSDLLPVLLAAAAGTLAELADDALVWDPRPACCVVMASGGYPGNYEKGHPITGIERIEDPNVVVFHAGTTTNEAGQLVTNGGRVLGVTALGADFADAQRRAYAAVGMIHFTNRHYRTDIARRAIARKPRS